jgi:ribonuclease P protein component
MPSTARSDRSLGRDRRVRKRADFARVRNNARRVTTPHFVFLIAARASSDAASPARLGFIVTRKVGNAVARNRIRRVCRECFRTWPELLPVGVDLVVVARQGADTLGLAALRQEWGGVSKLLRRRAEEALAQKRDLPHLSGGRLRNP